VKVIRIQLIVPIIQPVRLIYVCFFRFSEQNIEDYFSNIFDNQRNLIENQFLMAKMNLGDSLHCNLYDLVSFISLSIKSISLYLELNIF